MANKNVRFSDAVKFGSPPIWSLNQSFPNSYLSKPSYDL